MLKYKPNMQETMERFEVFWNKENTDRCNLAIMIPRENPEFFPPERQYTMEDQYTDAKCIANSALNTFARKEYLYEAIPVTRTQNGCSGQCYYFGSKPSYASDSVWWSHILPEPDASLLQYDDAGFQWHKQLTRDIMTEAGDYSLIGMNDNCSSIDALAAMRGTENLLADMIEEPEFVHEAMAKLVPVWKKTQIEFYEMLREKNFGGASHDWMHLWAPEGHVQLQCDYSVMISPAMYEEFVLPELEETSATFDRCTYHLDGIDQVRHLDLILSVKGIDAIQWSWVAGQPKPSVSIEALQRIQKAGKGLLLFPGSDMKEIEYLLTNLSPKGLQLVLDAKDREQAEAIEKLAIECAKLHR